MKHDWKVKRFGDICESDLGKTLNQSKDKGELYPYLCSINVLWDKFDFTVVKQTRFDDKELERYTVRKGDLLICEGGDIGRAAIWNQDNPILYQNALHRVRLINNDVIPRFVMLFLKYLKLSGVLDTRYGKGVTIKHLVKSSLLSIPIPVPERAEQERIVGELDCLSGIIAAKRAQLRELDTLAQSIFYTMFGSVDNNVKGYEIKPLSDVFVLIKDGTHQTPQYTDKDNGVKFLSAKDVVSGYINWNNIKYIPCQLHDELYKRVSPQRNDILLCKNGTYGICALVETDEIFDIYVSLALLRPFENYVPKYLVYAINNPFTKRQFDATIKGIGVPNLHLGEIKKTKIIVPPYDLQKQFAEKIENIERQKELITKSIKETEDLFNSRMDYYFN